MERGGSVCAGQIRYFCLSQPLSVPGILRHLCKVAQHSVAKLHPSNLCLVTFICVSFLKVPLKVEGPSREMIVEMPLHSVGGRETDTGRGW